MSSAERLEELIIAELISIPTYLWGGFFPIHIALWRFLIEFRSRINGPVDAYKQSIVPRFPYSLRIRGDQYELTRRSCTEVEGDGAYSFGGPQVKQLADILWQDGPIMDSVEELAYVVSDDTNRESFLTGHVSEKDLPPLNMDTIRILADELFRSCFSSSEGNNENGDSNRS